MKKFWSILTKITLILNPITGFMIVAAILSGYWFLFPLGLCVVYFTLKFYAWGNKESCDESDKWWKKMNQTHRYLGECYGIDYWQNITTKEIIET